METLTNVASAASRAIFGEGNTDTAQAAGQEPVFGKMGDTSKGEPYDAGNSDLTNTEKTNTQASAVTFSTTTDLPTREKADTTTMSSAEPRAVSEKEHDKTGITDLPHPSSGFTSDKPSSSNEPKPLSSGIEPSVSADPSSGVQNTQKHQGADRPEEVPSTEHKGIQDAKKEAEDAQKIDVNGPGPVPLEQLGKDRVATKSGGDGDDGPQKESHGEGTGEKYVQSSGMKSDGGDFDAANPGAGKEADRLLQEKGVHHTTADESAHDDGPEEEGSENKKTSLKQKIKNKLHKH